MTIKQKEAAYARGIAKGREALVRKELTPEWREALVGWCRLSYPRSADLDIEAEIVSLDAERLANPPNIIVYPETRGLPDLVRSERQGFLKGAGCDEHAMAFHYTHFFYCTRRLNARYAGSSPINLQANHCTSVYIRDSSEGGALFGRTLDDVRPAPELEAPLLKVPPDVSSRKSSSVFPAGNWPWTQVNERWILHDHVSSAVIGDEEPREIFPVDVWDIMPDDCLTAANYMEFLTRYNDFWGPCNGLMVDEDGNSLTYEKSNCRIGVSPSTDGTAAITACAYLIPAMHEFKNQCARRVLADDALDWEYWRGCETRYRRLLQLTNEANNRGATLNDMAAIVIDHAVPFPDRICLAGEKMGDEELANWTQTSLAAVITGPARRTLFWRVEGDTACYENLPFLIPGEGVDVLPEWKKDARTNTVTS
ncbi:MAG: hypothetical protein ABI210_07205 [Abditibacteriaceae bacterium]